MKYSYKIYIFGFLSLLPVAFLLYCFYPVWNYDIRYSSHVNLPPNESLAAGRILLSDRNGEIITDIPYPNGYFTPIEIDIKSQLVQDIIKIEDQHFFAHWGVNAPAKLRAFWDNVQGNTISGGSTITEQYVKNKYFKTTKRSYLQKLREAVLALYLDAVREKNWILSLYLQDAYFGNQNYGLGAAMEVYFQKTESETLTPEERVILISLLHNPGVKHLDEVYFQKYMAQVKKRLGYAYETTYSGTLPQKQSLNLFPHVTEMWKQGELGYPNQKLSLDARLQRYAQTMLQETLEELKDKNVTNGALYALDPKTGEVLLYLGSKDFYARDIDGQVDVVQARRQPGSTVKPFLYLLALESGVHPDSLILDMQGQYESFQEGKVYISENYSLKEYGLVRLKKALGNSFNNASVRLARELGLERVYDFYKSYGFDFPFAAEHYGYSLVLGNAEMTLEHLVGAYTKLLKESSPEKFLLYDILSDPDNRDISFGVHSLLSSSIPQAVKTGTSSDFRDNWVLSYHPDFVFGVWVGNNDNSSMQGVTGISGAGYIWHQVIEKAIELGYIKNTNIPIPEGISQISYCLDTPCIRRENVFAPDGIQYYSRIAEDIYSSRDIFENLSLQEQERLRELGIFIEND